MSNIRVEPDPTLAPGLGLLPSADISYPIEPDLGLLPDPGLRPGVPIGYGVEPFNSLNFGGSK